MDRLYEDPDLARFYDIDNGWHAGPAACLERAKGHASFLDLGCGTGALAAAVAKEGIPHVVGVDPAKAMLDIARARPGGDDVRWVEGDARAVRLGSRFDLIVLTGHVFQVFLTDGDRLAVLRTIASHLTPQGHFIFDSRNPLTREWQEWTPDLSRRVFTDPHLGEVLSWNDVTYDEEAAVAHYETFYELSGTKRVFAARSSIAFPPQEQLADLIGKAGLEVLEWFGDWAGTAHRHESPEIIPFGRLSGAAGG